jgi:predicted amidophosphoribosyltransferase
MAQHCANCGRELRDDDSFCAACGTPVETAVAVQSQVSLIISLLVSLVACTAVYKTQARRVRPLRAQM